MQIGVGLDLDGVITDLAAFQTQRGQKYFLRKAVKDLHKHEKKLKRDPLAVFDGYTYQYNPDKYDIAEIFGCSNSERTKFWARPQNVLYYCTFYPIRPDAAEFVNWLNELQINTLVATSKIFTKKEDIITKINESTPLSKQITLIVVANVLQTLFRGMVKLQFRLGGINIPNNKVNFCSEVNSAAEKTKVCLENNIQIMIEDKEDNIMALAAAGILVLMFDAPWNQHIKEQENIIRIRSFTDAKIIILKYLYENQIIDANTCQALVKRL